MERPENKIQGFCEIHISAEYNIIRKLRTECYTAADLCVELD